MTEVEEALMRLERAVARLEAACDPGRRAADEARADEARVRAVATSAVERVDAALAKLGQLLERED